MKDLTHATAGFPTARIPGPPGGLPVEVCLIAQLGPGAGDRLFAEASARQRHHASFVDALDEPSARIAGTDLRRGDATALYSFAVDRGGHPFHRHAGHRVFTAVSGSGGARLRFSTVSDAELATDPRSFVRALRHVDIPPDAMFTVRFGGAIWHQFAPLAEGSSHPVFFALSCHTDELGGILEPALRERVVSGDADIPMLTELLPAPVAAWLAAHPPQAEAVAGVRLSLHAPSGSWRDRACSGVRRAVGLVRRALARASEGGFVTGAAPWRRLVHHQAVPPGSLLAEQGGAGVDHEDMVELVVEGHSDGAGGAVELLERVLEGFLCSRPAGVTWLMRLRNCLVRPLRLRTSALGCPVSSLLSKTHGDTFAGRFPVLAQRVDHAGRRAQVILGADDRHLAFRSCVAVETAGNGDIRVSLGTQVRCHNLFGRFYMALISRVHRGYIAPALLRSAVAHALPGTVPTESRPVRSDGGMDIAIITRA